MSKELTDRLHEQNNAVQKMNLKNLELEHRSVLEKMVESRDNYNDLYGYYFSLVVELYSRYVLKRPNEKFTRAEEYRNSLQKNIEDSTST